jgi:hypothetical protein
MPYLRAIQVTSRLSKLAGKSIVSSLNLPSTCKQLAGSPQSPASHHAAKLQTKCSPMMQNQQSSQDLLTDPSHVETMIDLASIRLMLNRIASA